MTDLKEETIIIELETPKEKRLDDVADLLSKTANIFHALDTLKVDKESQELVNEFMSKRTETFETLDWGDCVHD